MTEQILATIRLIPLHLILAALGGAGLFCLGIAFGLARAYRSIERLNLEGKKR